MADIFISYAKEDRAHKDRIARALEAEGWSVWSDAEIRAGTTFPRAIAEAIEAARCVVVLWSTTSVENDWVYEEAERGKQRRILLPIQIEPAQIPLGFGLIQTASLVGWDGAPAELDFRRLVRDISAIVGNQPRPDEQRPAPEWTSAREHSMVGKTLRNFRIVSVIGEGGMGVVYLAEHVRLPKRFAIKSLSRALGGNPDFRRRFYAEAQKQALLDDPNIVQVKDFIEESGEFFLVMEYVDGQDLSRLIKGRGRLPEADALPIVRDILKGLAFAHAKGLVHRDIKPSNVLVDQSGRARIMDFGIAIMAGGVEKSLTAAGAMISSPWYMSPEQIMSPREVDQRADIYALGIVLYEMLTGGVPFDAETPFGVEEQQIRIPAKDPREKNPEVSEDVARIVLKAMAKDPGERFQNCQEFAEALDAIPKPSTRRRRSAAGKRSS